MSSAKTPIERPRHARIACRACHARKVRCSGGVPCDNCQQATDTSNCIYPNRNRRVKVEQSYINSLLDEIQRLRRDAHVSGDAEQIELPTSSSDRGSHEQASISSGAPPAVAVTLLGIADHSAPLPPESVDTVPNPMLHERPWFVPLTPEMPNFISEATDVAFATRFRQELMGRNAPNSFPCTLTIRESFIFSLWNVECPWPSPSRARFLLKVFLSTACRRYYLVQKSSIVQLVEQVIRSPQTIDLVSTCKIHAVFALGEAYSTRSCISEESFPGLQYFVSATRILRVLSEQPRIECVEIIAMLSIFAIAMNHRHNAYSMVGCMLRFCLLMGLHVNVPSQVLRSRESREHRNRVWWTAYTFDRTWACMLGKPIAIHDDDIDVDLPSSDPWPSEQSADDFGDTEYFIASLRIANLGARITGSIYARKKHSDSLSSRVQQALKDLGSWLQNLPSSLRTAVDQAPLSSSIPISALFLYFNQCLILASRPVLLHVLQQRRASPSGQAAGGIPGISETVSALADACIQCARRSYRALTEAWINGSFPTFDYTYTQYLFSSSTILAISSLLQSSDSTADFEDFEAACQILHQLGQSGNITAKEFCGHVEATKVLMESISRQEGREECVQANPASFNGEASQRGQEMRPQADGMPTNPSGLALEDVSLQDLLSHQVFDLQSVDLSMIEDNFQTFLWPEEGGDHL